MSNALKFSTSVQTEALNVGNYWIGTGDVAKGPTDITSYWSSILPPAGGYTVYLGGETGGYPATFCPANDAELISLTNRIAGTNYSTAAECLAYYAAQPNRAAVNKNYPPIVTNGLSLLLDASYDPSYPTTGTTWYDLSGNVKNSTLFNGSYFSATGGDINFDGVDDYAQSTNVTASYLSSSTIDVVFKVKSVSGTSGSKYAIAGYNFSGGNFSQATTGFIYVDISRFVYASVITSSQVYRTVKSVTQFQTGRYYRATLYKDTTSGLLKLYLNGIMESSISFDPATYAQWPTAGTYIGNNNFIIASYASNNWGSGPYLNGAVSSCYLYNRLLSDSEVLQNYYQAPIVTSGLVFAVDAGNLVSYENGSTTTYSMTGSIPGYLLNGVVYNSGNGGTWDFDGTDDYIDFSVPSALNFTSSNAFSTEAWINWDGGAQPNNAGHIIGKTFGNYRTFLITNSSPGQISFRLGTNTLTAATSGIVSPNTWYHVVSTFDSSTFTAKVFVNGVESASNTNVNISWTTSAGNFQIGRSPGENYYFNGKISTGRAYNKTLTPDEVLQNFNAQRSRFGV